MNADQCVRMLHSQHFLLSVQCSSIHLFGRLILPLVLKHRCQITDAGQCRGMLHSQHFLTSVQRSTVHFLGRLILSLVSKHQCQITDAGQCVRMLHSQHFLISVQRSSVRKAQKSWQGSSIINMGNHGLAAYEFQDSYLHEVLPGEESWLYNLWRRFKHLNERS